MRFIFFILFLLSCESEQHPMGQKTVQIMVGEDALVCSAVEFQNGVYLTSAHCVDPNHNNLITLDSKRRSAKSIIIHPNWDSKTVRYDLAIIVVSTPQGVQMQVGQIQVGDQVESVTQEKVKFHEVEAFEGDRFKAKGLRDSICKGDSGSPTYYQQGGQFELVGIVSGITKVRKGCGDGGVSVFADLRELSGWIYREIDKVKDFDS